MLSRIALSICFLFFAKCLDQAYTLKRQALKLDGSLESGSNFTKLLEKFISSLKFTPAIKGKQPHGVDESKSSGKNYLKDSITKYFFGNKAPTGAEKRMSRAGVQLWEVAETLISDLAAALSDKPDEQAIVQPGIEKLQNTVLQDMKSGRIRGPVHVYGRHAYQDDDD